MELDHTKREQAIQELENISFVRESGQYQMSTGHIITRLLPNLLTSSYCQIFESVYNEYSNKPNGMPVHTHSESREVFYQLKGQSNFSDGSVLNQGEIKIIEAGEEHGVVLSAGSALVIIAHPPIKSLPKGSD